MVARLEKLNSVLENVSTLTLNSLKETVDYIVHQTAVQALCS